MRVGIALAMVSIPLLAACGGGSGGVGSTPTPPPAPTNTTLTNLQASQGFVNDASSAVLAWDRVTKTGISGNARPNGLAVSYDATTKSYTVSADGRSQTFGQSDVQTDTADEKIFTKTTADAREYLTLVKIPYTGTQPTQYVGLGYWQRNTVVDSTQNTEFTSFTYGLPTEAAAIPKTGLAGFSVDAFGLVSAPGEEPNTFSGRGTFSVDFGAGIFSTHTYMTEQSLVSDSSTVGGGLELTAAGQLASNGTFSGNSIYGGMFGRAAGTLGGRFYGPSAQELGATFYGQNADGMSVVGSFTGQRDTSVQVENLTLTNLTHEQIFYGQSGPYGSGGGQLIWKNAETFIYAPPYSDMYGGQFTINDKVASINPNFTTYKKTITGSYDTQDVTIELYKPGSQNSEIALTYASFGRWSAIRPGYSAPVDLYFAYGLTTPAGLLAAKSGTGRYLGVVYGTGRDYAADKSYEVRGSSIFEVDFRAQNFSGEMAMTGKPTTVGSDLDLGRYFFGGSIVSYNGAFSADITGGGVTAGHLDSRFYGPDGQEIGGSFYINVPGTSMAVNGVTVARRE